MIKGFPDFSLQDKTSRTNRCGHIVAGTIRRRTNSCRTKCCKDKSSWTYGRRQIVADISSYGQFVAQTKCCMDKWLQGQIAADKMLQCFIVQYICISSTNLSENHDEKSAASEICFPDFLEFIELRFSIKSLSIFYHQAER